MQFARAARKLPSWNPHNASDFDGLSHRTPWHAIRSSELNNPGSLHIVPATTMLYWTVIFLIVALAAGVLGFGTLAGTAASIAKICFVIFVVLFLVSVIRGRSA